MRNVPAASPAPSVPPVASSIPPPKGISLLLAALAMLGPFAVDTYLPSFHDIEMSLNASSIEVQQTLTAYLLSFSIMALWHGALADALGRRRVVLVSLALFCLSMGGAVFATRIEHLWILRAVQGMSAGAGVVISRAIVRDLFDGEKAHRLMSNITMMFALAPAIAPVIGGNLQAWFGWRSIFIFLALMALAVFLACWHLLPETLPPERRQSLKISYLARSYKDLLISGRFMAASGAITFNFAAFFIYIMSAPVFLMRHLHVPETGFLWLFGPAMLGLMCGAWVSGRLAGKLSYHKTVIRGYFFMALAVLCNLIISFGFAPAVPLNVIPLFIYTLGMSIATPCLTLFAMEPFPNQRGLAASCQMFLQSLFNTFVAGMLAPVLWGSTKTLAVGMLVLMLIGALFTRWHYLLTRKNRKRALELKP